MMVRIVKLNKKGFTLVEMLVAMVIILVLLLGLVQAALLSIDSNLRNLLRDEAVRIAEQRMSGNLIDKNNNQYIGLKDERFDDLVQNYPNWTFTTSDVSRNFRGLTKDYSVCWRIRDLTTDTKTLEVSVGWNHREEVPVASRPVPTIREYQHTISTILRRLL